jgi:hypothetical protein
MAYSAWATEQGRIAISANERQPRPVAGYITKVSETQWIIEGDSNPEAFTNYAEAAEEIIRRFLATGTNK